MNLYFSKLKTSSQSNFVLNAKSTGKAELS